MQLGASQGLQLAVPSVQVDKARRPPPSTSSLRPSYPHPPILTNDSEDEAGEDEEEGQHLFHTPAPSPLAARVPRRTYQRQVCSVN